MDIECPKSWHGESFARQYLIGNNTKNICVECAKIIKKFIITELFGSKNGNAKLLRLLLHHRWFCLQSSSLLFFRSRYNSNDILSGVYKIFEDIRSKVWRSEKNNA